MKKALICVLLLATLMSLISCGQTPKPKSYVFYEYFDTVGTLYDYTGGTDSDFAALCSELDALLMRCHRLFDIYNEYDGINNLATVNKNAGGGPVSVDEMLVDFLLYCKNMYSLTRGEVNVAFGAVLSIWHDYREAGAAVPDMAELLSASEHTDIDDLVIDEENLTVELLDPEMSLDVGAIAKGYAAELAAEYIRETRGEGYALDLGGNLCAVGTKPNGDGWTTGIKNSDPLSAQRYVYTFTLADMCTVTSGSYERYYTVDGVRYHHIIDKDTLMPKDELSSVSIIARSSALCDALSTAVFNMEYDEIKSFFDTLTDVKIVLVHKDGTVEILEK